MLAETGFEDYWPPAGWDLQTYGSTGWQWSTCSPHGGSVCASCASTVFCDEHYQDGLEIYLYTGPLDLRGWQALEFSFWYRSNIAAGDIFQIFHSWDGSNWMGQGLFPDVAVWDDYLNAYTGLENCVDDFYFAFGFKSDWSATSTGVFVDDVTLRARRTVAALPDFRCSNPAVIGWPDAIIISDVEGTNTDAAQYYHNAGPYYIDAAVTNGGTVCGELEAGLFLNAELLWDYAAFDAWPGWAYANLDRIWTPPSVGLFTFELATDYDSNVTELVETNNACMKLISVNCVADDYATQGTSVHGYSRNLWTSCSGATYCLTDNVTMLAPAVISTHRDDGPLPADLPGPVVTDADNVWDQDPEAVDAHYHTERVATYMADYPINRVSFDDDLAPMTVTLASILLACTPGQLLFTPDLDQVIICDPAPGTYSGAAALDAVAHEWGHGISEHPFSGVPQEYAALSGALLESFSDAFGAACEWAMDIAGDWLMGEDIYTDGSFNRDLQNPRRSTPIQPDSVGGLDWFNPSVCTPTEGNDFCEVHKNAGVPNRMFYLLSEGNTPSERIPYAISGLGVQSALRTLYDASVYHWPRTGATFRDAVYGMADAASAIPLDPTQVESVKRAWAAVGVCDCPSLGDTRQDGVVNVIDVVDVVNVAFRSLPAETDPICPFEESDVNCDGVTDVVDVVTTVNVAFRGRGADTLFCSCAALVYDSHGAF